MIDKLSTILSFKRHDLLFLTTSARRQALKNAEPINPGLPSDLIAEVVLSDIPAIVKRQEEIIPDYMQVGFSSNMFFGGSRIKIKSSVPIAGIKKSLTPFEVFTLWKSSDITPVETKTALPENTRKALKELGSVAENLGISVGVFGSLALQIITGLLYVNEQSDIDICISSFTTKIDADFQKIYELSRRIADNYNVKFDIEVLLEDGAGVKLQELVSGSKTILCKGLYSCELRARDG